MKKTTFLFLLLVVISTMLIARMYNGPDIASASYASGACGNCSTDIRPKSTGSRYHKDRHRYGNPDCCSRSQPEL